jgi:hypothetical protein
MALHLHPTTTNSHNNPDGFGVATKDRAVAAIAAITIGVTTTQEDPSKDKDVLQHLDLSSGRMTKIAWI